MGNLGRIPKIALFAVPVAIGAGALYWALAPSGAPKKQPVAADAPATLSGPQASRAQELIRDRGGEGTRRQIDAYRDWASDPKAVGARKLILATLFSEKNLPTRLSNVLDAVEADPTDPEKDPLWDYLVDTLSQSWRGDAATKGMDLMFAETRPRARRALIASFAHLANTDARNELTPQESQKLTEYFIDLHKEIPAGEKPNVDEALKKLAGRDVVEILNGKGLGADDHVLDSEKEYEQALTNTQQELANPSPAR